MHDCMVYLFVLENGKCLHDRKKNNELMIFVALIWSTNLYASFFVIFFIL